MDPSSKRLAIGFQSPAETEVRVVDFRTQLAHGARLADIHRVTVNFARTWAPSYPPLYVWVEQPSGRHVPPILWYSAGAVQAALYEALRLLYPFPVEVRTITPGDWKKRTVGHGDASKAHALKWAQRNGYGGENEDEADAYCIAHAGRSLLTDTRAA